MRRSWTALLLILIHRTGAWVIPPQYDSGGLFSGGLAPIDNADGTFRYVDTTGKTVWQSRQPIGTTTTAGQG